MNRFRNGIGFNFSVTPFILCGGLLVILAGCTGTGPGMGSQSDRPGPSDENAESVLRELVRRFETRNTAGFLDLVHSGYKDSEGNRNDLRYRISRVTDQYGNIDARVFVTRSYRRNSRTVLETRWTLEWTCRTTGPGCYSSGETLERSGRSQFSFSRESRRWRLRRQDGAELFGGFQPGRVEP